MDDAKPLRVLFLGYDANVESMRLELRRAGFGLSSRRVETVSEMETALQENLWDVVLADDTLPGFDALSALSLLRNLDLTLPLIVVSIQRDEEQIGKAMKAGVRDYLPKCSLTSLVPALKRALHSEADLGAHKAADDSDLRSTAPRLIDYARIEIADGKARFTEMTPPDYAHFDIRATENARQQQTRILNSILSSMGDGVVVCDEHGKFLLFNAAAEQILGIGMLEIDPSEWSKQYGIFLPDQITPCPPHDIPLARAMRGESVSATELFIRHQKSPQGVWISVTARPLRNETGDLCGGVAVFQDCTERKQAEQAKRNMAAERDDLVRRLELQIMRLPMAYVLFDPEMRILEWNPAAEKTFGYAREEAVGRTPFELILPPPMMNQMQEVLQRIRQGDMNAHSTNENHTKDGRIIKCQWYNTPLMNSEGKFIGVISLAQDITEQTKLEEQLRQAQKMEAIGQLAGGIAHDFNNSLTAINIYNHLLINLLDSNAQSQQLLHEIQKATERSASLTRQLLALSSKQALAPQILCPNNVIHTMDLMLRRVIGEDIELCTLLDPLVDSVQVDQEQLDRVLLNLVMNARDAMPGGGKLTIETNNVTLNESDSKHDMGIPPGRYVMLSVTDSGAGMSPETQQHIFEPFFTTKERGIGSGLGLAVVRGIIKQSEGHIAVESEAGQGSCIRIYLPRVEQPANPRESSQELTPNLHGHETILLVEDDEAVRKATRDVLVGYGYVVLEARNGEEALLINSQKREAISMLVTDVVMPHIGGRVLAERLLALRPELKTLYISGYADGAIWSNRAHEQVAFLAKPFSPASIGRKIREVLDGS